MLGRRLENQDFAIGGYFLGRMITIDSIELGSAG
jgi:hypothetical protein